MADFNSLFKNLIGKSNEPEDSGIDIGLASGMPPQSSPPTFQSLTGQPDQAQQPATTWDSLAGEAQAIAEGTNPTNISQLALNTSQIDAYKRANLFNAASRAFGTSFTGLMNVLEPLQLPKAFADAVIAGALDNETTIAQRLGMVNWAAGINPFDQRALGGTKGSEIVGLMGVKMTWLRMS